MNLTKIMKNKIEYKLLNINWTPLHTRFISHRIGDGTVNFYGHFVYDNKNVKHFLDLGDRLNIKVWGPIKGDCYSTKKIIISKKEFKNFSNLFNLTSERLLRDPVKLLDFISQFPEEHKLQTIFALIVDDGSCNRWMITVFEDQNKAVFDKVKDLWDSLFPNTSRDYIQVTKRGTKVYHLDANRKGIILLQQKINESVKKYGPLADLWWKQKDLDVRYAKAVSNRAKQLNYTKIFTYENKHKILDYLRKNKFITTRGTMKLLNLSLDRTRLVLNKLVDEDKIFLIDAGYNSRYSLI
tara:strand:- start:25418 stop:26305 length:888 start_codon:yes stop_codon:yes gene_type:complete